MLADVLATTVGKGAIQCYTVLDSLNESEFNLQILHITVSCESDKQSSADVIHDLVC